MRREGREFGMRNAEFGMEEVLTKRTSNLRFAITGDHGGEIETYPSPLCGGVGFFLCICYAIA